MNVSLRQLRAFVAVARYGSFTLAADSLYITQSALSGLMRDLEQALQVRLVDRSTRRIRLTDVGSQLFPLVQKILDDLDTVMAEVGKLKDLERGLVRVAVPQLLASTWLPPMLAGFRQQHPQIELRLLDSTVETVVSRVFAGEVDFGIGPEREPNSDIEATLLFEVPFLAALPAGHALAARAKLRWEDLIAEENVVVTVTHSGFIKRTKADEYRAQHRGGKGIKGAKLREDDVVDHFFLTSTHNWLLFFTNKGRVYRLKAYELPEGSRDSKGQHVANLLQFGPDETIQTVLSIPNYDVAKYLVLATRSGKVKKTALAEYDSPRQGGLIAVRLMTGENGENADELIGAALCNAEDDIILVSKLGMSLKFQANDEQLRPMGRQTAGVQGMKFRDGDELLAMDVVQGDSDRDLLVVTNEGFAKRTAISEYRLQGRNGYGVKAVQLAEGRGSLVGAVIVEESDQIMAIMKSGKVIRSNVAEVKRTGRTTQGVTLAKPDKNDEIISIARNEETDEDDAEQAAAENGAVQNDAAAQSQAETTTENSAETGTEATSDAGDGENVEA